MKISWCAGQFFREATAARHEYEWPGATRHARVRRPIPPRRRAPPLLAPCLFCCVVAARVRLQGGVVGAIDGEKDPRNLMYCFQLVVLLVARAPYPALPHAIPGPASRRARPCLTPYPAHNTRALVQDGMIAHTAPSLGAQCTGVRIRIRRVLDPMRRKPY